MDKLLIAALSILSDDFGKRDAMREAILEGRIEASTADLQAVIDGNQEIIQRIKDDFEVLGN